MNVATHILLATDFSEAADAAVVKAGDMARMLDAKLTVLNVHGHPPEPPEAVVAPDRLVWSSDLDDYSHEQLEELKNTRFRDIEWIALAFVEDANPSRAICDYARGHGVDMIVTSTHARKGMAHFLYGSVAEKVVRQADCAVLIVPEASVATAC
jgi:universal stress protein A